MVKFSLECRLPHSIRINRHRIPIRTSYQTVLYCLSVLSDDVLEDTDKVDLCLRAFLPVPIYLFWARRYGTALFEEIFQKFVNVDGKKRTGSKSMDFFQDAAAIYAGFYQCYGLDLLGRDRRLHWWKFLKLLNGLPDDTRLMQLVSIRTRPMPKPNKYNAQERAALLRLKAENRLEITEEERNQQFQAGLAKMASAMLAIAKKDGKHEKD